MEGGGFFIDDTPRPLEPSTSNKRPVALQAQPSRPEEVDYTANLGDSRNGCSRCTSLSFSEEFRSVFGVLLCNACRRQEKLISKAAAKKQYCLTDGDLAKLGSVKRNNPHRKDWQPMRLYLEDQVQKVSYKKYGGFQGLESHARAMLDQRLKTKLEVSSSPMRSMRNNVCTLVIN